MKLPKTQTSQNIISQLMDPSDSAARGGFCWAKCSQQGDIIISLYVPSWGDNLFWVKRKMELSAMFSPCCTPLNRLMNENMLI